MNTEDMITLTCCHDHIVTENIWFVWSKTSEISGDVTIRDNKQTHSKDRATQSMQWMHVAEFRKMFKVSLVDRNANEYVGYWDWIKVLSWTCM